MIDAFRPRTTGTRLSLPLNGIVYTTTREVAAEKPLPAVGTSMEPELGVAFRDSLVIEASEVPEGTTKRQTIVHAIIPPVEDQLASNWESSSCSIGGQKFDGVTRTFVFRADEFDRDVPALGSLMPVSSDDGAADSTLAGRGYILVSRALARGGMQLEPTFRVEAREYVRKVAMRQIGVDGINGKPLIETTTLYHAEEEVLLSGSPAVKAGALFYSPNNPFWGLQDDGFEHSGSQLSAEWYSITRAQVVAGETAVVNGVTVVLVANNVPSNDRYSWPPVLQYIELLEWKKREGGSDIFPRVVFKHEGFSGPSRTETTRTWSKAPFAVPVAEQMLPNSIHYSSPFFSINVPECLHDDIVLFCDIGNSDPTYLQTVNSGRIFLKTNHTDWPSSIIAYDDQEPYRGGYLRTTRRVYSPTAGGGGGVVVVVTRPGGLTATRTGTEIHLTWDPDPLATAYLVEVALDPEFGSTIVFRYATGPGAQDVVGGMAEDITYYCRVSTLRGVLRSLPSDIATAAALDP